MDYFITEKLLDIFLKFCKIKVERKRSKSSLHSGLNPLPLLVKYRRRLGVFRCAGLGSLPASQSAFTATL